MRRTNGFLMVSLLLLVGLGQASSALAQFRINNTEMRTLIRRIETRTDSFSRNLVNALDNSTINGTSREDEINRLVRDLESATDQLSRRFETRQATSSDARAVLDRAALINSFMLNNRFNNRATQDWSLLRADLDRLAVAANLGWRWDTVPTSPTSGLYIDSQTIQLAQRVAVNANQFRRSFDLAVNRSRRNNSSEEYQIRGRVGEFQLAATRLRDRISRRQATQAEVQQLLEQGRVIDNYMSSVRLPGRVANDWNVVRTDLGGLASRSNISWNWDSTSPLPGGPVYGRGQLTGTYRIETSTGDDPRTVAENATRNLPAQRRDRVYQNLLNRLESPDTLAIDQRGRNVSIASSRAPQIAFVADGREQTETTQRGRTITVRANLTGDQLVITRTGEREQDFTVTFDPIDRNRLVVTRQLYTEQVGQTVTVRSYYTRTSDVAQLDLGNFPQNPGTGTIQGDFIVPNGTPIVAVLDTSLSTSSLQEGDRFTMTVRSPLQYEGATIEGRVTNISRSGRVSGRSELSLDFETIRLRNGRSYGFAGILEGVRNVNGDNVSIDNEGAVRDSNQTNRTIQRGAIGAAIGAIIGAIAGGGQGAAIGAAVGAGAGAGSVYVQGRDDLRLDPGTEVTIRATGPR